MTRIYQDEAYNMPVMSWERKLISNGWIQKAFVKEQSKNYFRAVQAF